MAMSYTTLVGSTSVDGSIAGWLNHSFIQNVADTIVSEAEAYIYRGLRHWRMLASVTGLMTANAQGATNPIDYVPLPSDYLEDKVFYITGINYQKLTRKTMEEVIASYAYDGYGNRMPNPPLVFFNDASNFKLDSPADQAYPYLLYYFQQPAPLSSSITNFLTQYYPRLVRTVCSLMAAEYMKDAGQGNYDRTYWEQQAMMELEKAQIESDRSVRSQEIGMILV